MSPFRAEKKPDLEAHNAVSEAEEEAEAVTLLACQRWNQPRSNAGRVGAVTLSFFVMGMGDGCIGIETYYAVSYTLVSLLFLAPCLGYLVAGLINTRIHHYLGQRGIALLSPLFHAAAYLALALHPPFPAVPALVFLAGLGSGLQDSAWNAWLASLARSHELLGIVHAAYGLGATAGPLAATAMLTRARLPWWFFFWVMLGLAALEAVANAAAFYAQSAAVYRAGLSLVRHGRRPTIRETLREPVAWLLAVFMLGYVGVEVSLGGWTTTFMLVERGATPFLAGLTATLYWLGITLGRFVLGFVTGRLGERVTVTAYLCLCIALQLLYWLVPSTPGAVVFVVLMGCFLGPLFPAAIVLATRLLPKDHHVSAIGFASAAGGVGGAVLPFAVGALAQTQKRGVAVLQIVVVGVLVGVTVVWLVLSRQTERAKESEGESETE